MSIDLEERLRRAAELLDHGAVDRPFPSDPRTAAPRGERSPALVRAAAAALVMIGAIGLTWAALRGVDGSPAGSTGPGTATTVARPPEDTAPATLEPVESSVAAPLRTTIPPAATLAFGADVSTQVPATVMSDGPVDWYRLQPDLDVAWYSNGTTGSVLCFRTPSLEHCQSDQFAPSDLGGGPVAIRGAAGQFLIVTLDPVDELTLSLSDGEVVSVVTEPDPLIGWRVGRLAVEPGLVPVGVAMLFDESTEREPSSPATSEPTATRA